MKEIKRFPARAGDLGWFEIADNKKHQFNTIDEMQADYDYVVIGAGFGGVMAASKLAENKPEASIALIDALPVGMGDSGRNAGLIVDVPHATMGDPNKTLDDHMWRLKLNTIVIDRIRKIKDENSINCDWLEAGKYLAGVEPKCLKGIDNLASFMNSIGRDYTIYEGKELADRLGINYYLKAIFTEGTISVNPAALNRGIATALPKNVHVFEESPVLQVIEGAIPVVRLVNGKNIRTKKVIVTASVFINEFGIKQSGRMFAINSFGAFTRELTDSELAFMKDIDYWSCTAAHPAGTTVRYLPNKRIFVRNGFTYATHYCTSPQRINYSRKLLRKAFENRFPSLKHVNFEYVYGGMIPLTLNTESLFGCVGENVYAGTVGDGLGITRSSMLGMYLADMVCDIDSEELRYLKKTNNPSYCPPEPFTTIGATARLLYEGFTAGKES